MNHIVHFPEMPARNTLYVEEAPHTGHLLGVSLLSPFTKTLISTLIVHCRYLQLETNTQQSSSYIYEKYIFDMYSPCDRAIYFYYTYVCVFLVSVWCSDSWQWVQPSDHLCCVPGCVQEMYSLSIDTCVLDSAWKDKPSLCQDRISAPVSFHWDHPANHNRIPGCVHLSPSHALFSLSCLTKLFTHIPLHHITWIRWPRVPVILSITCPILHHTFIEEQSTTLYI